MCETLKPSASLLCKLGSIVVHAEELTSVTGHAFDRDALIAAMADPEVCEWLNEMRAMAMLPMKRTLEDLKLSARKRTTKKK